MRIQNIVFTVTVRRACRDHAHLERRVNRKNVTLVSPGISQNPESGSRCTIKHCVRFKAFLRTSRALHANWTSKHIRTCFGLAILAKSRIVLITVIKLNCGASNRSTRNNQESTLLRTKHVSFPLNHDDKNSRISCRPQWFSHFLLPGLASSVTTQVDDSSRAQQSTIHYPQPFVRKIWAYSPPSPPGRDRK